MVPRVPCFSQFGLFKLGCTPGLEQKPGDPPHRHYQAQWVGEGVQAHGDMRVSSLRFLHQDSRLATLIITVYVRMLNWFCRKSLIDLFEWKPFELFSCCSFLLQEFCVKVFTPSFFLISFISTQHLAFKQLALRTCLCSIKWTKTFWTLQNSLQRPAYRGESWEVDGRLPCWLLWKSGLWIKVQSSVCKGSTSPDGRWILSGIILMNKIFKAVGKSVLHTSFEKI